MKNKVDKLDIDDLTPAPVDLSNLGNVVKKIMLLKKLSSKYITTQEFNSLTADNSADRLKQANLKKYKILQKIHILMIN